MRAITGITLILSAIGLVALLAAFNLTNNLPGYLTDADPLIHDNKMQAGGLDVSAE